MADGEKLRALLAEARAELHSIEALTVHPGMHHGKDAARLLSVLKRIDAALAEPVVASRMEKPPNTTWARFAYDFRERAEKAERERDEARAEAKALREVLTTAGNRLRACGEQLTEHAYQEMASVLFDLPQATEDES